MLLTLNVFKTVPRYDDVLKLNEKKAQKYIITFYGKPLKIHTDKALIIRVVHSILKYQIIILLYRIKLAINVVWQNTWYANTKVSMIFIF